MKSKNGFTIVELVIVIAVIAILAAILIPTFSNVIKKADESAILQEAKSKFNELYAVDYADGMLDGAENGVSFIDNANANSVTKAGYDGCYYNPNVSFIYETDKYKCTATLTFGTMSNEWKIAPVD